MQDNLGNKEIKGPPINREYIELRIDEIKKLAEKTEEKVDKTLDRVHALEIKITEIGSKMVERKEWDDLKDNVTTIKSGMITKSQLLWTALGLAGAMIALVCTLVVHFFMKYMPMSGGN